MSSHLLFGQAVTVCSQSRALLAAAPSSPLEARSRQSSHGHGAPQEWCGQPPLHACSSRATRAAGVRLVVPGLLLVPPTRGSFPAARQGWLSGKRPSPAGTARGSRKDSYFSPNLGSVLTLLGLCHLMLQFKVSPWIVT